MNDKLSNPVARHLPQIDALRALAVLAVLVFHLDSSWLSGGFSGVDVFFVISGYVVSASLFQHAPAGLSHFVAKFYARRMVPILPALLVCLLCTTALTVCFVPESWLSGANKQTVLLGFLGLSNFALINSGDGYFAPRVDFNMATHTWSLAVEEQFYFVFPLLFYFWLRASQTQPAARRSIKAMLLPVAVLLSAAWAVWASLHLPSHAYYSLLSRFWELGAGAWLYRRHVKRQFIAQRYMNVSLCLALGLVLVFLGFWLSDRALFPMPWALLAVFGTLLLIDGIVSESLAHQAGQANGFSPFSRCLAWPPVVWVGKISYSLYLWHWPVYAAMRWTTGLETASLKALAVASAFLLATLSYRFVENPVRRSAALLALKNWQVVSLGAASTATACLLALLMFTKLAPVMSLSVTAKARDWYAMDWYVDKRAVAAGQCGVRKVNQAIAGAEVSEYSSPSCAKTTRVRTLFVVGDSHASAYSTNFSHLVKDHPDIRVRVYSRAGCSYLGLMTPLAEQPAHCRAFAAAVESELLRAVQPGDLVFLPSLRVRRFADQYVAFGDAVANERMNGAAAMQARSKAVSEAGASLHAFASRGITVLLEAPKPVFRAPPFRCSDWFNASNPICAGGLTMPQATLEQYRRPVLDAMKSLQASADAVHIWDPFPLLCPGSLCETRRDGRPMFFDGDHLSGFGNDLLYPEFEGAVLRLMK